MYLLKKENSSTLLKKLLVSCVNYSGLVAFNHRWNGGSSVFSSEVMVLWS